METRLEMGMCGHCGNKKFKIYQPMDNKTRIMVECTKCNCSSEITLTQPKLEINWHNNSDGILCFPN